MSRTEHAELAASVLPLSKMLASFRDRFGRSSARQRLRRSRAFTPASAEVLEVRALLAADLIGYTQSNSSIQFDVLPQTNSWGDTPTVSLYVANQGNTAPDTAG